MDLRSTEKALLCADVTEYTRAMEVSEQQLAERTTSWVDRCVCGWLSNLSGEVVQHAGDSILLAFDSPLQALEAVQRLQSDWQALGPHWNTALTLPLRIALHWGRVWRGSHGYKAHSLNQLARLAQQVTAGEVWASAEIWHRLPPDQRTHAQDLGWMHFKHLAHPLQVFRLCDPLRTPSPVLEPHVGAQTRLLVCDQLGGGNSRWTQVWVARLQTWSMCTVSAVVWPGPGDHMAALLHHARADGVLRRREQEGRAVVEWIAGPQAMVLQRWVEDDQDLFDSPSNPHIDGMLDALQTQAGLMAMIQPVHALSTGVLRMAALHLMHAGSLKGFERAEELLQAWAEREARQAEPPTWRVMWHVMRHTRGLARVEPDQAMHCANQALRLNPNHGHAWAARGLARAHLQGDLEGGLRDLSQAAKVEPGLAWIGLYRSVIAGMLGERRQALEMAMQALPAVPAGPSRAYALGMAGHAAVMGGQATLGMSWLESSWRAHRHHSPTLRMLVVANQMLGQHGMTAFYLRELFTLEPHLTARAYLGRTRAGHGLRTELAHWLMTAGLPMK